MIDPETLAALASAGLCDADIADVLDASARTVRRARAAAGIASAYSTPAPLCGTLAAYRRGCDCLPCRAANAGHTAAWRARRGEVTAGT